MIGVPSPVLYAGVEFVAFWLATLNFRYCAKGHIGKTLMTDVLLSANGFVVIRLVAEASSPYEIVGYVMGAAGGSLLGMWMTRDLKEDAARP